MYSQNDEEKYILEAVGDEPGVFLDIGAYDGKTFSNTAALVDRGWSGVLVEPSISAFEALRRRYWGNQRLILVHAAIGPVCGIVKFWESRDAVSTTSEKHHELWNGAALYQEPYYIAQVSVSHLVTAVTLLRNVDVVSVDTEGTSGDIFMDLLTVAKPRVAIVEYDSQDKAITGYAEDCGFHPVYKSNENLVLVHESVRSRAQVSHG